MQALVYTFIALSAAGVGATAYFGLTFTPVEAILAAIVVGCVCIVLMERILRQRAENRLEKAIEDLSRLLSTDAQAGAVLGQRINAMTSLNPGGRLDTVEADLSVLGTVIRQVAEAVADIEDRTNKLQQTQRPAPMPERLVAAPQPVRDPEPIIPLAMLRQSVADNRLIYHIQPIVTLPQRRPHGYDLLPRLMLEDGDLADSVDFMPRKGGHDVLRHIEALGLVEAITVGRRARTAGQVAQLYVPLSRATLGETAASEQLIASLEANRAIAGSISFAMSHADWQDLTVGERAIVDAMVKKGTAFSLTKVKTLRIDVAELADRGVRSLRIDAARFIDEPEALTDFHAGDIANYLSRFSVTLLATGITGESQIVELLEDGITLVQGPHISAPGPIRPDLMSDPRTLPTLRRAEV